MTSRIAVGLAPRFRLAARRRGRPSPPVYDISFREATIPLPDGVRLAADLSAPSGGQPGARFPVLLEYLPYRKTESRAPALALYSYFVRRGYVVARVDIRGTGNSEGRLIAYEYTRPGADRRRGGDRLALEAVLLHGQGRHVRHLLGRLQLDPHGDAKPAGLKAIIAVDATDDLYQDDVHFMDGIIHVDSWEMGQDLANVLPGRPTSRSTTSTSPTASTRRPGCSRTSASSATGRSGSARRSRSATTRSGFPTFVIGGSYDGYRDSVPRMLEHLKAPIKAIVGPWHHAYPARAPIRSRRWNGATRRCAGSTSG